ncbi:uncharacterized protein BXZ73DRAFT_101869 [Epithele typhae]|uniref:uncharacterized protein n=1 Tax=Epithele typhae TaxID=378194 RepID=UPI00200723F3|nr:uncharacterized protein BXZ73DRAFT_101869 [Epithele typhae]KAH9930498.1 hypothetical protein BXZ73DRAFT_101869 [Epithele typhae]
MSAEPSPSISLPGTLAFLNIDVLLDILALLPRRAVATLSRTCRALHTFCLRPLFAAGPIILRAHSLAAFHAALRLNRPDSRAPMVTHVVVRCSLARPPFHAPARVEGCGQPASVEELLEDIFRHTLNIRRLELDWGAAIAISCVPKPSLPPSDSCATAVPRVSPSSTPPTLSHLEDLHAPFVSEPLWAAIVRTRAPSAASAPTLLLAPFRETLEDVDLAVVHCADPADTQLGAAIEFPRVHRLALADTYCGTLRGAFVLGPAMRAFPAVTEFALSATKATPAPEHWHAATPPARVAAMEWCRAANARIQEDGHGRGGWDGLARVVAGTVADLYMLGLRRAVRAVAVDALSADTLWMLGPALADARPERLALVVFARADVFAALPEVVSAGVGTARLRALELAVRCDAGCELDAEGLMTQLAAMLAPLRVEEVVLRLLAESRRRVIAVTYRGPQR